MARRWRGRQDSAVGRVRYPLRPAYRRLRPRRSPWRPQRCGTGHLDFCVASFPGTPSRSSQIKPDFRRLDNYYTGAGFNRDTLSEPGRCVLLGLTGWVDAHLCRARQRLTRGLYAKPTPWHSCRIFDEKRKGHLVSERPCWKCTHPFTVRQNGTPDG